MSRRIQILDTTLRDGEQSPGIALQPHEKAEIAEQLERLGVDVVEAGFPGASPGDFEGVRTVAAAVRTPVVAAFARTHRGDIEAAGRRARRRPALSHPSRARHERAPHGEEAPARAGGCAPPGALGGRVRGRARDEVEFSCEDATRSDPAFVALVCRAAIAGGVTVDQSPRHGRLRAADAVRGIHRGRQASLPRAAPA